MIAEGINHVLAKYGKSTIQFGLLTGTVLSGTNIGQTFTTSGLPPSVGLISKSGDELPMATV